MTNLDIIFQEWTASLGTQRTLTKESVDCNFNDLFMDLKNAGASWDEAYPFLNKAIKAHSPSSSVIKMVYQRGPKLGTLEEFQEHWLKNLSNKATSIFFDTFPRPKTQEERKKESEPNIAPKKFGSFTEKEYREYRAYADSFEVVDIEELNKKRQLDSYNPLNDAEPN